MEVISMKYSYGSALSVSSWLVGVLVTAALLVGASVARGEDTSAGAGNGSEASFTDAEVARAIKKAQRFLLDAQNDDGTWAVTQTAQVKGGVGSTAIVTYALLESGISPASNEKVAKALDYLEKTKTEYTYSLAFRALAFASASRYKQKYAKPCRQDGEVLYRSFHKETGGYTYTAKGRPAKESDFTNFPGCPDASNSQYALLGVWTGARRAKAEVPRQYWKIIMDYWLEQQRADGGWGYSPGKGRSESYMAMTLAGLASVYICVDELYAAKFIQCRGNTTIPPIEKGLRWVDKNFEGMLKEQTWFYYTLYGLERVALASGKKYFGQKDWYKLGTAELLRRQNTKGSFRGKGVNGGVNSTTSYALLFLVRGRRPVLMNKLEFTGDWNNRPRDAANVTRWMREQFEVGWTWQIIPATVPVKEWHDAPILYISGAQAPRFTNEQVDKLRTFVNQGGIIFSAAECGGAGFKAGIRKIYKRMFPDLELTPCGPKHPVYSSHYNLRGKPKLYEINNGIRPLVIHTDEDLPKDWQLYRSSSSKAFETMTNITFYATSARKQFRPRGQSPWPAVETFTPRSTVKIARLKHNATYDPEPLAWQRFSLLMGNREHVKLDVTEPMSIGELSDQDAKIAAMTGLGSLKLTEAEKVDLRKFLEGGGTLIVDAAGGNEAFAESARKQLDDVLKGNWDRMTVGDPVFSLSGGKIKEITLRRATQRGASRAAKPKLRVKTIGNRSAVLLSELDLTAGLVGYPFPGLSGPIPEDAYRVMRNLILHSAGLDASGDRSEEDSTQP